MSKRLRSAIAALALVAGTGVAGAQTIVIPAEQQTVIREYVRKQPLASIELPGIELNIGSRLADDVELHAIEVPDVRYRYVVVGGRTVLVDPDTRAIVHVMD